jgi:DNA replication and repair protein RecF
VKLNSLSLTNFRNLRSLELQLGPGLTVFHGQNAQGKSNLLEAIYVLAIGKSYRTTIDKELMSWEAPGRRSTTIINGGIEQVGARLMNLQVALEGSLDGDLGIRKRIRVNGAPRKASELVGLLNAVLFSSEDIQLIHGPPQIRRRYLDILLSQISRQYMQSLQRYQHVLIQRNRLLKTLREGNTAQNELLFWDESLCEEGATLLYHRHVAIGQLAPLVGSCFQRIGGSSLPLQIDYITTVPAGGGPSVSILIEAMKDSLAKSQRLERAQAVTLIGPHRDDLRLTVDGIDMSRYSSRGQARLAALSLRLGEGRLLENRRGDSPVLLLDDTLSELDEDRRNQVLQESMNYPQTILTTADLSLLPQTPPSSTRYLRVANGIITSEA